MWFYGCLANLKVIAKIENNIPLNWKLRANIKQHTESYKDKLSSWVTIRLFHNSKLCLVWKRKRKKKKNGLKICGVWHTKIENICDHQCE